jgi:hypothetical protein
MTRLARIVTALATLAAATLVTGAGLLATAQPAAADCHDGGYAGGQIGGGDVTGDAEHCPLAPPPPDPNNPDAPPGQDGPVCWYEPPRFTDQEGQRTTYHPEEFEDGPGQMMWRVCEDGTEDFVFVPDAVAQAQQVDPQALAESVVITPGIPRLRTSPPIANHHLVNIESWFWIDPGDWEPVTGSAEAGPVEVTVTATPGTLVIDPGDGSPALECPGGGTPYSRGASSTCTHTYERSGTYQASVTIVYDVAFSSNIGAGGPLGPLTPDAVTVEIPVEEAQALNDG